MFLKIKILLLLLILNKFQYLKAQKLIDLLKSEPTTTKILNFSNTASISTENNSIIITSSIEFSTSSQSLYNVTTHKIGKIKNKWKNINSNV
jgi:hypothetical protein